MPMAQRLLEDNDLQAINATVTTGGTMALDADASSTQTASASNV